MVPNIENSSRSKVYSTRFSTESPRQENATRKCNAIKPKNIFKIKKKEKNIKKLDDQLVFFFF